VSHKPTQDAVAVVRGTPKAMASSTVVHSIAAVVSNGEGIFDAYSVFPDHHKIMFGYDLLKI
jgi:hypothetical protein